MKTVDVKYLLSTRTSKVWEDFDLPVAVTDQWGKLYLIVSEEVADDYDEDSDELPGGTMFAMVDIMSGHLLATEFESIRDMLDLLKEESDLDFTPVKLDLIVNEYLSAQ